MDSIGNKQPNDNVEVFDEILFKRVIDDLTTLAGGHREKLKSAEVLNLRLMEKLPQKQVADRLGLSVGQVVKYEQLALRLIGIENKINAKERTRIVSFLRLRFKESEVWKNLK